MFLWRWRIQIINSAILYIGAYGKDCDSSVFQRTIFFELMTSNQLKIPAPCSIDSTSNIHFPFVLVADKAFGLSEHLMTPYAGHNLTEKRSF